MPSRDYNLSDTGMPPEVFDAVENAMVSLSHVNHVLHGEARTRDLTSALCGAMAFTLQVMGTTHGADASAKKVEALAQTDVDRALAAFREAARDIERTRDPAKRFRLAELVFGAAAHLLIAATELWTIAGEGEEPSR